MSEETSLYSVALQKTYAQLAQSIHNPEILAGSMYSRGMIGRQALSEAENRSISAYNRSTQLLKVVQSNIEGNIDSEAEKQFRQFVAILRNELALAHLANCLEANASTGKVQQESGLPNGFQKDFNEEEMQSWFTKIGLNERDTQLLIDEGFGTAPGYMELTEEDIDDMTFTRGGKKLLRKNLVGGPTPVPMDTTPPANVMMPLPQHPAASGGPPPPFPYTPPPEPVTADSICDEIGLHPYALDTEFSDNYSVILAFAKLLTDWKQIAQGLKLSAQDIRGIETNISLNFLMQCTETLKRWKSRFGFKARYRMLVNAALEHGLDNLAYQFCRLVQKLAGGANTTRVRSPQPAKPVSRKLTIDSLLDELAPLAFSRSNNGQLSRALGVPDSKLSEFEANNYHDIRQVRTEILQEWLKQDENLSWQAIATALSRIGELNLSRKLMAYRVPVEKY